jgi:hypothetical protein
MPSPFHNLSAEQLADEIGKLDTVIKSQTEQLDALKDEFKRRDVSAARGDLFVVTASTSTSKRLDTKRLRADLGDALDGYESETTSTRLLIKPSPRLAEVA